MSRSIRCIRRTAAFLLLAAVPAPAVPAALATRHYARSTGAYEPPAVTLVDPGGAAVPLRAELARPGAVLLQFVFTTCATVCPVLTATFAAVQDRLTADDPDARLLSISIDPEEDTPARLREQAARLRAGRRWRFLTGRLSDVVAVQKAFDAYPSDKMRHQPLTFLRSGPSGPWLRLEGFPSPAELLTELAALRRPTEPGRRLYREGVLPSGLPLRGVIQGDVPLAGVAAACATCHRRSGFGGVEGTAVVPPITAPELFTDREPRRAELFAKLYQEELSPSALARLHDLGIRPAYTAETLSAALRDGRDPTGRTFDPLMPRYRLSDAEIADLAAYLRTLAAVPAPGVDGTELHFATVIAPGVATEQRRAVLGVLEAYVRRHNADLDGLAGRPGFSPRYKAELFSSARRWVLHVWDLAGPAESWPEQLAARYREQPVFAMISGVGSGEWAPVHDFCEREEVPCLFPETDQPPAAPGDWSLYLSAGLSLEAEAVARHLRDAARSGGPLRVVQVYREDDPRSAAPARALRQALAGAAGVALEDQQLAEIARRPPQERPDALVAWLAAADLAAPPPDLTPAGAGEIVLSWSLLGGTLPALPEAWKGKVLVADRFALPPHESPHAYRAHAWLRSRGLDVTDERLQLDTWFTLSLVDSALMHLVDNFSRAYFVEILERETERVPNPGIYPRLSLGAGQRFASKGCYLVRPGDSGGLAAAGEWIVP